VAGAGRAALTTPVDRLLLWFLAGLAAAALLWLPEPGLLLLACGSIAAGVVLTSLLRGRSRAWETAHAFAPLPALALLVNLVGPVIVHANPNRWDERLRLADRLLLGGLPDAWLHALGRPGWLTDFASLAYAGYYLMPVAAAAVLWGRRQREEFDRLVFALVFTLLASFAAYFILPAAGPRVPDDLAAAALGGGAISEALRAFLRFCERNPLDAFPSGHTALSLVFLAEAWPLFPRARAVLAAAVAAIVFSTVYLSLHYAIDVLGGVALAAAVLALLPRLRAREATHARAAARRVRHA